MNLRFALLALAAVAAASAEAACSGGGDKNADLIDRTGSRSSAADGEGEKKPEPAPGTTSPPPGPRDCSAPDACPGPAPGMPNTTCTDGSIGGPVCTATEGGACGWTIRTCPDPEPGPSACGKKVCGKEETCCEGVPFREPTCVAGTMCPVSQRKHKKDITYLSEDDRQRLRDELMSFRLATYRYKTESSADREHLGFIIDDVAPSAAVTASGERVDMYGYQTMAVATLQMQAREIAQLRRELDDLKREAKKR